MNDYQYFLIKSTPAGCEDINYFFYDNDEPIDIICGNLEYNQNPDPSYDYFVVQTYNGKALFFPFNNENDFQNGVNILSFLNNQHETNIHADKISCFHEFIFISSDCKLYIFSINKNTFRISFDHDYTLPAPVMKMKATIINAKIYIYILLQNYSMIRINSEIENLSDNVTAFDINNNQCVCWNNDKKKIFYDFHIFGNSSEQSYIFSLSNPCRMEVYKSHNCALIDCISGSNFYFGDKIMYCNLEKSEIVSTLPGHFQKEVIFETNDQIIAFCQLIASKDLIVIKRRCLIKSDYYCSFKNDAANIALNSIDTLTGEFNIPVTTFFDSVNILNIISSLCVDQNHNTDFIERREKYIQLISYLIKFQKSYSNILFISKLLNNSFFKTIIEDEGFKAMSPITVSCLAFLIDKSMKCSSLKASKSNLLEYSDSIFSPVKKFFTIIHQTAIEKLEQMPPNIQKETLLSLLSSLKNTICDIVLFGSLCKNYGILGEKTKEQTRYLIERIIFSFNGKIIEIDQFPNIIDILLHVYQFFSQKDSDFEIRKKIINFFQYIPKNYDIELSQRISNIFKGYLEFLNPKFEELFDKIRFYPSSAISSEISNFLNMYVPIPSLANNIDASFKKEIDRLTKSGTILKMKINYINLIHNMDDYILLNRSELLSRKTGNI